MPIYAIERAITYYRTIYVQADDYDQIWESERIDYINEALDDAESDSDPNDELQNEWDDEASFRNDHGPNADLITIPEYTGVRSENGSESPFSIARRSINNNNQDTLTSRITNDVQILTKVQCPYCQKFGAYSTRMKV